MKKGYF